MRDYTLRLPPVRDDHGGTLRARIEAEIKKGRNTVAPYLDIDLNPCPTLTTISLVGTVEEFGTRWHFSAGGQCRDTIAEIYASNERVQEIVTIWRRWHLNDSSAGTREQRDWIERFQASNPSWRCDYGAACEQLKAAGLVEVGSWRGISGAEPLRPYRYGEAWLAENPPAEVTARLRELLSGSVNHRQENFGILMTCGRADHNPHMCVARPMDHWRCSLRRNGKYMVVVYSKGMGHGAAPTVDEVLDCLLADAAGYEAARNFGVWCSECGYGEDDGRAARAYQQVARQTAALRRLLGTEYDAAVRV